MENQKRKENKPLFVGLAILYIGIVIIQIFFRIPNTQAEGILNAFNGMVQRYGIGPDAQAVIGPLNGIIGAGNTGINGVLSQFQVLCSLGMIMASRKKGLIFVTVLNLFNAIRLAIIVVTKSRTQSLPGVVIALVTIIIAFVLYFYLSKNDKMIDELNEKYEQISEQNRTMKDKDEALNYLAYYDRLTQMPNRQLFIETLEGNVKNNEKCSIIYADLDDFRKINDTFGHGTGDELLKVYAERIENLCKENDFSAKIGGDEFGIILDSSYSPEDIAMFVGNIQRVFAEPVVIRGDNLSRSASFGVASFPESARSAEDLFRCAETAMFTAKTNGKNQYAFYQRR